MFNLWEEISKRGYLAENKLPEKISFIKDLNGDIYSEKKERYGLWLFINHIRFVWGSILHLRF